MSQISCLISVVWVSVLLHYGVNNSSDYSLMFVRKQFLKIIIIMKTKTLSELSNDTQNVGLY